MNNGVTLPKWFLMVMSGVSTLFLGLFVPWAAWVTITLATLTVKFEDQDDIEKRLNSLTETVNRHIGHPELHYHLRRDIDILRRDVNKIMDAK